jgi:single-stranded DNA-binding protein
MVDHVQGIQATFQGQIALEPDCRYTQAGKHLLRLLCSVPEFGPNGFQLQSIRVSWFGEGGERIAPLLHRGSQVECEGRVRLNQWTDPRGVDRAELALFAMRVTLLPSPGQAPEPSPDASHAEDVHELHPADPVPYYPPGRVSA